MRRQHNFDSSHTVDERQIWGELLGEAEPPTRFASGTREIVPLAVDESAETTTWNLPAASHDLDLDAIPDAVFVIAADDRISDANRLAETLVGYARRDLVGRRIETVVSRLTATVPSTGHVRFVSSSAGVSAHHCNGRELPVEVLVCPHDGASVVAVVRPLPGPNPAGLREEDVAQIVHDLKNPLATIALEACLLDGKLADPLNTDTRRAVGRIAHNIAFLDRMVQELLDLCSIDAGRFEIHRVPTELRALLADVVERVVSSRERDRVTLETAQPVTLAIDDLRIERVVANFIQNALKYAPKTSDIVVRLDVAATHVQISVIDAGPGMTPEEMSYVFDKYRRTNTARAHEGCGLGLFVSKQIVEAHGGRIGVESVRGTGSRFYFELPRA